MEYFYHEPTISEAYNTVMSAAYDIMDRQSSANYEISRLAASENLKRRITNIVSQSYSKENLERALGFKEAIHAYIFDNVNCNKSEFELEKVINIYYRYLANKNISAEEYLYLYNVSIKKDPVLGMISQKKKYINDRIFEYLKYLGINVSLISELNYLLILENYDELRNILEKLKNINNEELISDILILVNELETFKNSGIFKTRSKVKMCKLR